MAVNNEHNYNWPDGFKYVEVRGGHDQKVLDCNIKTKSEFKGWIKMLKDINPFKFVIEYGAYKLKNGNEVIPYKCHHANLGQTGARVTNTKCPVTLTAVITGGADKERDYPCRITIKGYHNHSTLSEAFLSELSVSTATTKEFYSFFEQGMYATSALRHYQLKYELQDDTTLSADKRINPTLSTVSHLRERWMQARLGSNDFSVIGAIQNVKKRMPQHKIACEQNETGIIVVLVTDFMLRVHEEMKSSSEVMFVNTTRHVDQTNCSLTILFCSCPAGGLPLGVIITSTQAKEDYIKGFRLLQEELGDAGFFGRRQPDCIVTDDSEAVRAALHEVWPNVKQFLCVFHVLQAAWRWLCFTKNDVKLEQRIPLILILKTLAYSESKEAFDQTWGEFISSDLSHRHPKCTEYFQAVVERRECWSLPWQAGSLLHGHNTNNICASMMVVIKEAILQRNKVQNASHLLSVMAEIYNSYLRLRLLDVIVKRNTSSKSASQIPMASITHEGGTNFKVLSETDKDVFYSVDLAIGLCTCPSANTGVICNHQIGCSHFSAVCLPQRSSFSAADMRALAKIVYGDEEVPDLKLFQVLKEPVEDPASSSLKVEDPPDEKTSAALKAHTTIPNTSIHEEKVRTFNYLKMLLLKNETPDVNAALEVFSSGIRNIKNAAQLQTFLQTAGARKRNFGTS